LSEAPFYACDKPGITLNEIKSISRMAIKKYEVEVIYIDHTRLMGSKTRESVERMTEISHGLKNLGKELDRPIVPLHQISRPPKGKKVSEPRLDDLRDSGAVEEDADNVVFIHRNYYYTRKEEDKNLATIIIAKQRNGPVDKVMMKWIPENTMFTELSTEEQW
jgi:replicative DNA helicase